MLYIYYHIFTLNKCLIHRTIGLNTWWRNLCWQAQRSDICCSFSAGLHILGGILVHSSLQILSKSLRIRGCRLATRSLSSLHRFSMGFSSGDWLGHSRTLICFFLSHSFVALAVCFGSVMLEDPSTTHFQCSH